MLSTSRGGQGDGPLCKMVSSKAVAAMYDWCADCGVVGEFLRLEARDNRLFKKDMAGNVEEIVPSPMAIFLSSDHCTAHAIG